jgi:hypothetical protein
MAVNININTSLFVTLSVSCRENIEIRATRKRGISHIDTKGRTSMNEEA